MLDITQHRARVTVLPARHTVYIDICDVAVGGHTEAVLLGVFSGRARRALQDAISPRARGGRRPTGPSCGSALQAQGVAWLSLKKPYFLNTRNNHPCAGACADWRQRLPARYVICFTTGNT